MRNTINILLILAISLFAGKIAASDGKDLIIAWPQTFKENNKIVGRYLLPSDACYDQYRSFLKDKEVQHFQSAEDAEMAGYLRKPIGIPDLKKYASVCSDLYEYVWASRCGKIIFPDDQEAEKKHFVKIENFDQNLLDVSIPAFEGAGVYFTPCDVEYMCFFRNHNSSKDCDFLNKSRRKPIIFKNESDARKAGYISQYEYFQNELKDSF